MFRYLHSGAEIYDLTLDIVGVPLTGHSSALAGYCNITESGTVIIQNVTVNGKIDASGGTTFYSGGFISYVKSDSGCSLYLIDCTNNAELYAPTSNNCGGFIGSIENNKANIYVYNCTNNGKITAYSYCGSFLGYGFYHGSTYTPMYVIGFKNTGDIFWTETSSTEPVTSTTDKYFNGNWVSAGEISTKNEYYDSTVPETANWYNGTLYYATIVNASWTAGSVVSDSPVIAANGAYFTSLTNALQYIGSERGSMRLLSDMELTSAE